VTTALEHLGPTTTETVSAVVNAANEVHGYAHVRRASMTEVRARAAEKLAELSGQERPQRARYPIAG
jgi:hypothetical protein